MRITLVQPSIWVKPNEHLAIVPPLGLCYLAGTLERDNHVEIINAQEYNSPFQLNGLNHIGLSNFELVARIKRTKPDIVGITCPLSVMWSDVSQVSRILRSEYNCFQILGGYHPTAFPNQSLKDSSADIIIMGEGERTFKQITDSFQHNLNPYQVNGIAFNINDKIHIKPPQPLIQDLDTIPFPARHLIDMKKYISLSLAQGSQKRHRYTTLISSRGCPNNCTFCSSKVVWTRKWRARSAENVIAEIEQLKSQYGINEIHFEDDNISLDRSRMNRICDLLIEKDIDITWTMPNGIEVRTLDKPLIQKMKKSGCYQVNLGIESGNQHILKNIIKKNINLDHTKNVIQWSKEAGIWCHGFFILGFPSETRQMIQDSINFAKNSNLDSAFWNIATPYPSTELYDLFIQIGKTINKEDFIKMRGADSTVGTDIFTPEQLIDIAHHTNRTFFKHMIRRELNPINMMSRLSKIKSIDDINYYVKKFKRMVKVW